MAQTGMETARILSGLIREIKPDLVIAIDALAARSIRRLGTTIQLTDTGIHPGSGVGNHRHSLTKETLGIPVLADWRSYSGGSSSHCPRYNFCPDLECWHQKKPRKIQANGSKT